MCDERWLWLAWLTVRFTRPVRGVDSWWLSDVQDAVADLAFWGREYPDHVLPAFTLGDRPALTLIEHLERLLPSDAAHLGPYLRDGVGDRRLAVWSLIDTVPIPDDFEILRSLLDVDPGAGMEAPADWTRDWLRDRLYRRWADSGVLFGFTHHSGVVLRDGAPWLEGLCRPRYPLDTPGGAGCYFDLALLVFAEAALELEVRRLKVSAALGSESPAVHEGAEKLLWALGTAVWSPVDQGRLLAQQWRRIVRRDLGIDHSLESINQGMCP